VAIIDFYRLLFQSYKNPYIGWAIVLGILKMNIGGKSPANK
jgi:hypothetical protein